KGGAGCGVDEWQPVGAVCQRCRRRLPAHFGLGPGDAALVGADPVPTSWSWSDSIIDAVLGGVRTEPLEVRTGLGHHARAAVSVELEAPQKLIDGGAER